MTATDQLKYIFDALYSQFILRDVFGKMVPGLIILTIFGISLTSVEGRNIVQFTEQMPFAVWIAVFGLAWVIGFAIQGIGELPVWPHISLFPHRKLFPQFPEGYTEEEWSNRLAKFRVREDHPKHAQRYERFIVIKEACGNTCASLMLATLLLLFDILIDEKYAWDVFLNVISSNWHILVFDLIVIGLLFFYHRIHLFREDLLLSSVMGSNNSERTR